MGGDKAVCTLLEADVLGALKCLRGTFAAALFQWIDPIEQELPTFAGACSSLHQVDGVERSESHVVCAATNGVPEDPGPVDAHTVARGGDLEIQSPAAGIHVGFLW